MRKSAAPKSVTSGLSYALVLTLKVSGCGRFRPMDAVEYRQPQEHKEIADAIDGPPPETPDCFEYRVRDFANNLRSP
jgi:hypothetical protein